LTPLQKKEFKDLALKNPKEILTNVFILVTSYLKNAHNSPMFYSLLKEALEFMICFQKVTDGDVI